MTRSEIMKQALRRPEVRAKISASGKLAWQKPDRRIRASRSMKKVLARPGMKIKMEKARAKGALKHRSRLDSVIAEMHADYMAGMSLNACGRKYGRNRDTIRELFTRRGLHVRPPTMKMPPCGPTGQILPYAPKTEAELEEMIQSATQLAVPVALKLEWRKWSFHRRGEFIKRLRTKLAIPGMPTGPLSPGLEAFDYSSEKAHAICAALNVGRNSQTKRSALKVPSQGVIFRGELWFWSEKVGYQKWTAWTPENGRPALHHVLWKEYNGRDIPAHFAVRYADGNWNNFSKENLILISKEQILRETQAKSLARKSRERTALLLKRTQSKGASHAGNERIVEKLIHASSKKPRRSGA